VDIHLELVALWSDAVGVVVMWVVKATNVGLALSIQNDLGGRGRGALRLGLRLQRVEKNGVAVLTCVGGDMDWWRSYVNRTLVRGKEEEETELVGRCCCWE
jgi:hypothetical protein